MRENATTRVVLLSARGKAFCSGMDLSAVRLDEPDEAGRFATGLADVYRKLLTPPIPLLCGVDGPVMGGGGGLALAADLVWAGPKALFAFPETLGMWSAASGGRRLSTALNLQIEDETDRERAENPRAIDPFPCGTVLPSGR